MKRFLIVIFLFASSIYSGQGFNKSKMDSLFMLIEQNNKGMNSISIFSGGGEVYHNSIGFSDVKNKVKATKETKYRIGSISKTFTAALIMKLVEEGKLTLDTKLFDFYPEIKNADKITVEHLLRHRSGIFNFTNAKDYSSWMENPILRRELVEKIKNYGSSFEPDSKTEYSNANYVLLSYIAEKLTDDKYSKLVDGIICKPCQLSDTYYGDKINPKNNEAYSYQKLNGWELATETDMSVPVGAGAIVSTPTDLNKFLICLFQHKIVSKSTLETMIQIEDGYGLGMVQAPFYDKKAYGHPGGIDGFVSNAFYFPEEKVSVAFSTNGLVMPMNDILIGILSIYFDRDYNLPEIQKSVELKSVDLDAYIGLYSSPSFPLKITISKKDNILFGQATGQPEFPLDAGGKDTFRFDPAKLEIIFKPNENKLILNQGGGSFELKKE